MREALVWTPCRVCLLSRVGDVDMHRLLGFGGVDLQIHLTIHFGLLCCWFVRYQGIDLSLQCAHWYYD